MEKVERLPVLFLGHGSPMNAIRSNDFTQVLAKLGKSLPKPKSILSVSAHWMTDGTWITHMKNPKTIHDFYGFPEELFKVQYPAPGDPLLAEKIKFQILNPSINLDDSEWGLDHGTWSVLKHLYPHANIPVVQLSLDQRPSLDFHFSLGKQLQKFREEGVLIVGSGNIVHNLQKIDWNESAKPYAWAEEFDLWVKSKIASRDFSSLINNARESEAGKLSIPTLEHYIPLLTILGASSEEDELKTVYEGIQNASISMRSIQLG